MAKNLVINGVTYNSVNSLSIPKSGGGNAVFPDTSDANATESDILSGKTAYVNGVKVNGTIPAKTSANLTVSGATVTVPVGNYAAQATKAIANGVLSTPTIVNTTGVVTAKIGTGGYLAVNTSKTLALATQAAQTITPSAVNQTIAANKWLTGIQTISGDADLIATNIKKDVQIFGVTGTYEGSGGGNYQSKSVTYTSNGTDTVTPDAGYDALSEVGVTVDVSGGGGVLSLSYTCINLRTMTLAVNGVNKPLTNNAIKIEEIMAGDTITVTCSGTKTDNYIYLNGVQVRYGSWDSISYTFAVTAPVSIYFKDSNFDWTNIYIVTL